MHNCFIPILNSKQASYITQGGVLPAGASPSFAEVVVKTTDGECPVYIQLLNSAIDDSIIAIDQS